ncbi:hypothetical protein Q664_04745 [Archangium violaceum Cb vi76]|uniref:Uncharacterized protein n=2 Tax=Archangium violaceum TaxID=83451 RepID=A0A084T050_9BACT|nr:hypothetical protein Q664_04745 [Archangium violaceum Cb vi76]
MQYDALVIGTLKSKDVRPEFALRMRRLAENLARYGWGLIGTLEAVNSSQPIKEDQFVNHWQLPSEDAPKQLPGLLAKDPELRESYEQVKQLIAKEEISTLLRAVSYQVIAYPNLLK